MATTSEEYRQLGRYFPGAQILPGWAPITPLNDFIRDVGFNRSLTASDVPVVGGALGLIADDDGQIRLGTNLGWDDYAVMNRSLAEGDYGQAAKSGLTGLAEVGGMFVGGGTGLKLAQKGLGRLFGRTADEAAESVSTAASRQPTLPGMEPSNLPAVPASARTAASTNRLRAAWDRLPTTVKWGLGVGVPAVGLASLLTSRDDSTPPQVYTPRTVPGSIAAPEQGESVRDILAQRQEQSRQAILDRRNQALRNFGAQDMADLEAYLGTISQATAGQSAAVQQQARELAGLLSQDVETIRGAGAEGAGNIRRRYGQAARRARREGRQERVRSGVGGLTPVSGAIADMPATMRGRGRDLASYLSESAAIAARDAGFDAASAIEYGNNVANQFQQEMALLSNQARFDTQSSINQQRRDTEAAFDDMLAQLELQGISDVADLETRLALEEEQALTGPQILAGPAGGALSQRWAEINSIINGTAEDPSPEDVSWAQNTVDFLNARYGAYNEQTFAQMYADYPQMYASLIEGQ